MACGEFATRGASSTGFEPGLLCARAFSCPLRQCDRVSRGVTACDGGPSRLSAALSQCSTWGGTASHWPAAGCAGGPGAGAVVPRTTQPQGSTLMSSLSPGTGDILVTTSFRIGAFHPQGKHSTDEQTEAQGSEAMPPMSESQWIMNQEFGP